MSQYLPKEMQKKKQTKKQNSIQANKLHTFIPSTLSTNLFSESACFWTAM